MPAKKTLFIFGDSITYGEWDSAGGWANRLRAYYDKHVLPLSTEYLITYNLGIPSDTSTGVAQRITHETQSRLTPNPDAGDIQFLIAIGTNDSRWLLDENKHGVGKDEFKTNLAAIAHSAKAFSSNISFVGLLPTVAEQMSLTAMRHNWDARYENKYIEAYNNLIQQHCAKSGLDFIDLYTPFNNDTDSLFGDGLHPNDKGHALIFDIIMKHLEKSIKK